MHLTEETTDFGVGKSYAQGKLATWEKTVLSQKATGQRIDVWRWRRSLGALLACFGYSRGQLPGEAGIEAVVDGLINRMRQVFIRRSLFE